MLKAEENPPITWPEENSIMDFSGKWWVAHTKSRNEKALAHDLIGKKISYFLPMTWKIRQTKGRKIRTLLPLFTGYLFFCGTEEHRVESLKTNRVANVIQVKDQQKLINELHQIEQAIRAGAPLTPHKYIEEGLRCRVIAGPMAGLEGIIQKAKNITRLVLKVDILGQASSLEIDTDLIEPVD